MRLDWSVGHGRVDNPAILKLARQGGGPASHEAYLNLVDETGVDSRDRILFHRELAKEELET